MHLYNESSQLCINITPNLFLFSFPFVKGYEYVGFLWRKHRPGLPELTMSGGELFNDNNFIRKPFIGHFQVCSSFITSTQSL